MCGGQPQVLLVRELSASRKFVKDCIWHVPMCSSHLSIHYRLMTASFYHLVESQWRLACASIIPEKYHPLLYYVKAPLPAMYLQWSRMQPEDVVASIEALGVLSRLAMPTRSPQFLALRAGMWVSYERQGEGAAVLAENGVACKSATQYLWLDTSTPRLQRTADGYGLDVTFTPPPDTRVLVMTGSCGFFRCSHSTL